MRTLIQRGFALLNRVVKPAAGESVRYIRGATTISDALPATLNVEDVELLTEGGGTAVIGRSFTWSVLRQGMYDGAVVIKPQRNDYIEWFWEGRMYRFEVMPDTGSAEVSAHDPRSDWIPVTVKLVRTQ